MNNSMLNKVPVCMIFCSLHIQVGEWVLTVVYVYGLNDNLEYPAFLESLGGEFDGAPPGDSVLPLGDFNAHVGSDSETCRDVIGNHLDVNLSSVLLLDFCANHSLSITNTMFKHKGIHKCTWHQDTLGCRSMIEFVIVSTDLWPLMMLG